MSEKLSAGMRAFPKPIFPDAKAFGRAKGCLPPYAEQNNRRAGSAAIFPGRIAQIVKIRYNRMQ